VFEQAKVNVIVDEVLIGDRFLSGYVKTLQNTQTYFVGVTCALEALEERELLRNNRAVGLAASQFHLVHAPERFYDLILDTTSTSPFLCAQRLLDFTNTHPQPTSIQKCAERMGLA
jgi:chloramphenicol 3-O phosphotransferase